MQDQGELVLPSELQVLQTRLDLSVGLFRQITLGQVAEGDVVQQLENVLSIYHQIPSNHRLQIEVDENGYKDIGGQRYEFTRTVSDPTNSNRKKYFIIVKAPVEHLHDMPEKATAVELSRRDLSPAGPTAFELVSIRKGGFDHGPNLWPQNIVAMKIVPNTIPLPK